MIVAGVGYCAGLLAVGVWVTVTFWLLVTRAVGLWVTMGCELQGFVGYCDCWAICYCSGCCLL